MNKTKQKIILSAVELFNELGLTNTRNQDVAQHADISLSNFNYHFKTKKDLVFAVMEYMKQNLEEEVYGNRLLVQEGQGLEITKSYFEFEEKFRFFYLDTNNIIQSYPELKKDLQRQISESIQMIKNLNYMAIGMGSMKPEPEDMPGLYDRLAEQIWSNNHFWFSNMKIRGLKGDFVINGLESSFIILYPYLTKTGITKFKNYMKSLKGKGKPKVTKK